MAHPVVIAPASLALLLIGALGQPEYLKMQAERLDCGCVGGKGVGKECKLWGKDKRPWCFVGKLCADAKPLHDGRRWRHCDEAGFGARGIGVMRVPAGFASLDAYGKSIAARVAAFQRQLAQLPPGDAVRQRILTTDLPPLHELLRSLQDTSAPTSPPSPTPTRAPSPPPTPFPTPKPGPTPDPVCAMCKAMKQPCKSVENNDVTCDPLLEGGLCAPGKQRC